MIYDMMMEVILKVSKVLVEKGYFIRITRDCSIEPIYEFSILKLNGNLCFKTSGPNLFRGYYDLMKEADKLIKDNTNANN